MKDTETISKWLVITALALPAIACASASARKEIQLRLGWVDNEKLSLGVPASFEKTTIAADEMVIYIFGEKRSCAPRIEISFYAGIGAESCGPSNKAVKPGTFLGKSVPWSTGSFLEDDCGERLWRRARFLDSVVDGNITLIASSEAEMKELGAIAGSAQLLDASPHRGYRE